MNRWLAILGLTEGGVNALPPAGRQIVDDAHVVIGAPRFLYGLETTVHGKPRPLDVQMRSLEAVARALLTGEQDVDDDPFPGDQPEPHERRLIEWEPPIESMIEQVLALRGTATVILATGDPLWFGIGATLAKRLEPEEFAILPQPSAFQLAAARLHWPLQHVSTISLHGRPHEGIHPHILPGNRILALTGDATTAEQVAEHLVTRGYGQSPLTLLENLGSDEERITRGTADSFDSVGIGDFYVLAVDCVANGDAPLLPAVPGLPDEAFVNDGQLTKREVRAATIAKLAPYPGALLWDVGAGCGSVAIEWMRSARDAKAIAFEREGERLQMISVNALALGVPTLQMENGDAPKSFAGMPTPDAIFIGGAVANDELFEACWNALRPGGRLVANAVTLEGEHALLRRHAAHGGDLCRIETAVLDHVGTHRVMRPRMAVTQWLVQKL